MLESNLPEETNYPCEIPSHGVETCNSLSSFRGSYVPETADIGTKEDVSVFHVSKCPTISGKCFVLNFLNEPLVALSI